MPKISKRYKKASEGLTAESNFDLNTAVKLLKENLNWKLLLDPELEFPEAYMRNEIIIENATMKEFLMDLVRNLGRNEITTAGAIIKRFYQAYRTFTNFNLVGKSKKNVEHHYDIGGSSGCLLYTSDAADE